MLLDLRVLEQSSGGDEEFARELLGEYRQRAEELIIAMRNGWDRGNPHDVRTAAHELKGSSVTLGAVELARTSRFLEDDCKAGQFEKVPTYLESIVSQAQELFRHLEKIGYL